MSDYAELLQVAANHRNTRLVKTGVKHPVTGEETYAPELIPGTSPWQNENLLRSVKGELCVETKPVYIVPTDIDYCCLFPRNISDDHNYFQVSYYPPTLYESLPRSYPTSGNLYSLMIFNKYFLIHKETYDRIRHHRMADRWFLITCFFIWVGFLVGGPELTFRLQDNSPLYPVVVMLVTAIAVLLKSIGVPLCQIFYLVFKDILVEGSEHLWDKLKDKTASFRKWLKGL